MQKKTKEQFIKEAIAIHGCKYDYSKVEYVNAKTKVCIICPKHGEFWQQPSCHLHGDGCKKCAIEKTSCSQRKTKLKFIEESQKVHGDKYDYSKVVYKDNKTKVCIICPEHGEFWQQPVNHLNLKQGCPKCSKILQSQKRSKTTGEFISEASKIHGTKYDYSKVEYKNWKTKVCIICPEHGEFWQYPLQHVRGGGCPLCANSKRNMTTDEFIEKAKSIHGDKYDYSKTEYKDTYSDVEIICKKHGSFFQKPFNHLQGCGCQKCSPLKSKYEDELYKFLTTFTDPKNIIRNDRSILDGRDIDIYIKDKKIGIEVNGIRWHSEKFKDKNYHLSKLNECSNKGVGLIQIFEDEIAEHKEIVYDKILHILGFYDRTSVVDGRKTIVRKIDNKQAKEFLNANHIQSYGGSSVSIGCFFNEKLIGVSTFISENNGKWILNRMATSRQYICRGVCGKMLSFFKKNFVWDEIKSFADRRWTLSIENNVYEKLGFVLAEILKPDYRYVIGRKRIHKFNFRKKILSEKYGLPMNLTETEMVQRLGLYKIWDCGLYKFILKKGET